MNDPELIDNRRGESPVSVEGKKLAKLQLLAKLMDSAFVIPGTNLRFGLDSLLGLFPGIGDLATSAVSVYILQEAHRRGVSRATLARMGFNVFVDWIIGSIPLAGDAFDVYWKSNQRNVQLLLQHSPSPTRSRRAFGDWLFLLAIIGAAMALLVGSLTITFFVVSSLSHWMWPTPEVTPAQ